TGDRDSTRLVTCIVTSNPHHTNTRPTRIIRFPTAYRTVTASVNGSPASGVTTITYSPSFDPAFTSYSKNVVRLTCSNSSFTWFGTPRIAGGSGFLRSLSVASNTLNVRVNSSFL